MINLLIDLSLYASLAPIVTMIMIGPDPRI